jgi:hypothetical protein
MSRWAPKTVAFVAAVERFADEAGAELVSFSKHQRKDDVTQQYLKSFAALQRICDGLDAKKIDRHLLRKWLARLPHPFDRRDRAAGYRHALSILQAEFALTQMLDRPVSGRIFSLRFAKRFVLPDRSQAGEISWGL